MAELTDDALKDVYEKISNSLKKQFATLEKATKFSITDWSFELYTKDLISKSVKEKPTYSNIVHELQAGLEQHTCFTSLEGHYESFLGCLSVQGGPCKLAAGQLKRDWQFIKQEFHLILARQSDGQVKTKTKEFYVVAEGDFEEDIATTTISHLQSEEDQPHEDARPKKSNDIEMKTMINTLEKDKEQALKKAQEEKDQIVAQLQAAVRENEGKQREIIELNKMLEKKDAEIATSKQEFENEHSKLSEVQETLADKLAEAKKSSRATRGLEEEIQVLTAQVNAYSRECEKQKGLVTQNQEKHNTECSKFKEELNNEKKSKQQLVTLFKQQFDSLSASKKSLQSDYDQEKARAASLEQQIENQLKGNEENDKLFEELMAKINALKKELEAAVKKINNKEKLNEDLKDLQEKKDIQIVKEREHCEAIQSKLKEAQEKCETLSKVLADKEDQLTKAKNFNDLEEEIQVLTAQVNAYSRECEKQKGLVTQNQEKHKTEVQELHKKLGNEQKSNQQLVNELRQQLDSASATKEKLQQSNQQLVNEMTILREQLDSLSASKESLLTSYNQEQAMVASLQQKLSIISRKEPDAVKTEFTDANEVILSSCSYSGHTSSHIGITSEEKHKITNTGPTSLSNNSQYNSPDPCMSLYPSHHSSYQPHHNSINEERERIREDTRNLSDYIYCPPTLHSDVSEQQTLEEESQRLIDEERKKLTQKADEALENVVRHRMKRHQTTTICSPPNQEQRRPSEQEKY